MAGDLGFQMDMFGPINEAITAASSTPMITANGRWQMAETAAFVAALRRGSLNEALSVINRLKVDTAWKVLLEAGFSVGSSKDRATMMAPVQNAIIEAAQRAMTGYELRVDKEQESILAMARPAEAHAQVVQGSEVRPITPPRDPAEYIGAIYMRSLGGIFVEGTSQEVPIEWTGVARDGEAQAGFVFVDQNRVTRNLVATDFEAAVQEARQYGGAEVQPSFKPVGQMPHELPAPTSIAPADDQSRVYTLEEHGQVVKAIRGGELTAIQMKSTFARFMRDKEPLRAELSAKKLKELAPDGTGGMKKTEVVDRVISNMMGRFTLAQSITWSMGRGSYEQAVAEKVNALTDQDMAKYAGEIRQAAAEQSAAIEDMRKAAENPETLEDFHTYIRLKKNENLSFEEARMSLAPEARAAFDELTAEKSRSGRINSDEARKGEVRVAAQTTAGQVLETKHTRTGEPLFVVQAAERVERDVYNQWNAAAKKLGGWYSSFRGNGAVSGFQFKNREGAEAFVKYLGGEIEDAQEVAQARRDSFADDRSQTAVERLREMSDRLGEQADASLSQERKANTERRARMAASAEASANADKAMAHTMRNIADGIDTGTARFLDKVRQKVQVEMLASMVRTAHYDEIAKRFSSYVDQLAHRGEPPTAGTADYVRFPEFTAYRSDLARLGRELVQIDGGKLIGQRILKVADDISDVYRKFAKENLLQVSTFATNDGQPAIFGTEDRAEAAIRRSGLKGKAAVVSFKRGEHRVIMGPEMAREKGLWHGDDDKRITLTGEFGEEIIAKHRSLGRANRLSMPYIFESVSLNRGRLKAMGIETPAELRAAVREFVNFSVAPARPDRVKELERAMVGRRNDGLDFFPTPEGVAQAMVDAAEFLPGMRVLEPSAGMGHIAEIIRGAGVEPDVVELSVSRRELLEAKGFNVVGSNFLDLKLGPEFEGYDRIIMNPPFSDRRDAEHVQHAFSLLKPGGRVVAIMGEGIFFGQDKKAQASREWMDALGGSSEKLPEGSFLDPLLPVNTGVSARMVVIDRGETKELGQSVAATEEVDAPVRMSRSAEHSIGAVEKSRTAIGDLEAAPAKTAEEAIRKAFEAREDRTNGVVVPLKVEFNGVGQEFLAVGGKLASLVDQRRGLDSPVHLSRLYTGKLLNDSPREILFQAYALNGRNELNETGLPRSATEDDLRRWADHGLAVPSLEIRSLTPAVGIGRYIGMIVAIEDGKAMQDVGRGQLVSHDVSKFEVLPEVGRKVEIGYGKQGMATAREIVQRAVVGQGR